MIEKTQLWIKLYLVPCSKENFMPSCKSSFAAEMRSWSTPRFLFMHDLWIRRCYSNYVFGASTKWPFSRRAWGKGAWQMLICDFSLGILGCALLHRWHRNSIDNWESSSFIVAFPWFLISSITSTESRKKAVLKEFQCFLFLRWLELKSWLMTCKCNCLIEGACKEGQFKHVNKKPSFFTLHFQYPKQ